MKNNNNNNNKLDRILPYFHRNIGTKIKIIIIKKAKICIKQASIKIPIILFLKARQDI